MLWPVVIGLLAAVVGVLAIRVQLFGHHASPSSQSAKVSMLSAAGTPLDSRLPFALRREFRGSSPVTILERVKGALLLGFAIAALTAACSGMIALVVVVLSAQIG